MEVVSAGEAQEETSVMELTFCVRGRGNSRQENNHKASRRQEQCSHIVVDDGWYGSRSPVWHGWFFRKVDVALIVVAHIYSYHASCE